MNANMANMNMAPNVMGGPVGGAPMPMAVNNGGMGHQHVQQPQRQDNRTILNTYIYDYLLREGMYDCARAMVNSNQDMNVTKQSPGRRRDENGNGIGDDPMGTDNKEDVQSKQPEDLPNPNLPASSDSCFLYEWFCLFWDMLGAQRNKQTGSQQVNQYINYTQQQSRLKSTQQQDMLRQMRPDGPNNMPFNPMMRQMQNGMPMNPKGNNLARTAMANNQNNPQAMHMLQQAKQNQMQRDPSSDMDGNRRPASPGSADNAPSPKRPRLDGGAPFNPNQQPGMMPNGRPQQQGMSGQQQVGNAPSGAAAQTMALLQQHGIPPNQLTPSQFQSFQSQPLHAQQKSIQTYAQNLQQHHGQQMPNKVPNAGGPQGQGSPMMAQGPNGAELNTFYNPGEIGGPGGMRQGAPGGQGGGSNHALQDYQMQLMLLEQQNKKRLMMARQEQDSMSGGAMPRDGQPGPGGPGGPGGPPSANGQPFADTSPQGQRPGASPNPSEQMKRGTPQMGAAGIPSPMPEGAQSRGSPSNGMSFMPQGMDPSNMAPNFFKTMNGMEGANMAAVQMNQGMRPPSSHPNQPFNGPMNPQQQIQMQQARQQAGQQGGPGMPQWQNGPNGANPMAPPGPQGPVQGTPQQRPMPPPSAPGPGINAASARTQPSSPANSNPAPPTPQQSNKAAPKKKDTKNAKSKAAAQKKNANTGATPAADASQEPEPPATPITPVNPGGFAKSSAAQQAQAPAAAQAPPPAQVAPQHNPDPNQGFSIDNSNSIVDFNTLDFANPMNSQDVLQDFDFDSFLHDGDAGDGGFDFNAGNFGMEGTGEIGAE